MFRSVVCRAGFPWWHAVRRGSPESQAGLKSEGLEPEQPYDGRPRPSYEKPQPALQETLDAYAALRRLKILCVKRAMPKVGRKSPNITTLKSLGFPSNHECQSSVKKMNYANEIGILDLTTGNYTTLYTLAALISRLPTVL